MGWRQAWQVVRLRTIARLVAALGFVAVGVMHFTDPEFFEHIVPPYLPAPELLVWISGAAEIAGGVGLLVPRLRRAAGWGLLALLVAVFPANVHMAVNEVMPISGDVPVWTLWARLPFQVVFAAWIAWVALAPGVRAEKSGEPAG